MSNLTTTFWPTARHFAEAVQCPQVCFNEPYLREMLPAVDRLGMPLVTSGQFAYVFKLNSQNGGGSVAVRCFRGYLGDREERYEALDEHLGAHTVPALPRFKYFPRGILVNGRRYPTLVMQWIEGPTLDVYLREMRGRPDVLRHLADEWVRLCASLREAQVAHGDLQHGNIIVEHGQFRLVDFDGMFVPRLAGRTSSEVGHQHYQHPQRDAHFFNREIDNFSAIVVYLSLISLAERPELWDRFHDENLLFTRQDFLDPDESALFREIKELGGESRRLAEILETAARDTPGATPSLLELVSAKSKLPAWMVAPAEVDYAGRTREVERRHAPALEQANERDWTRTRPRAMPSTPNSYTVHSIFNTPGAAGVPATAPYDPADVWGNTVRHAGRLLSRSYFYVWWIPVYRVLDGFWAAFGVTDFPAVILTLLLFAALFLLYGFLRAMREQTRALQAGTTPAGNLAGTAAQHLPPPPPTWPAQSAKSWITQSTKLPAAKKGAGHPVVGNQGLRIYHVPECDWVDRIPPQQRIHFPSPADAYILGFRPCKICDP